MVVVLLALGVIELGTEAILRAWCGGEVENWQELEKDERVQKWCREKGGEGGYGLVNWDGSGILGLDRASG